MEIGSIYEIDPKILLENGAEEAVKLEEAEKYGKAHVQYTASGREAIALALKSLAENRPGIEKRCLLPAYMCDTVFFPFTRAGWEIHFYKIKTNLEAEKDELCQMIEDIRPGLLFIHAYYGVDTWKPMRSLLHEWKRKGICIMEDVTQSYYLPEAGKEADYVVGSLRKWYPVPDGGFAASDAPLTALPLTADSEFTRKRIELLTEKWAYLYGSGTAWDKAALKSDYLKKNRETEEWLDCFDGINGLSGDSVRILNGTEEESCKKIRNANYRFLRERIAGKTSFRPVFQEGPLREAPETGTAPLYFPVYADDRDRLQEFLRVRDIYAPVLWPVGRENADSLTETEEYIYNHILALPIDQRYRISHMERIADVLEEYETEYGSEVIGIRADANETVAAGHIMRCITIAKQLKNCGKKVMFFTADAYAHAMLEEAGMEYICLNTSWNEMETEVLVLKKLLAQVGCRKLLVDSYQATRKYMESLNGVCRLIYVDDCFEDVYPVDMLINYNAFYTRFPYREIYGNHKGRKTRLLLGTEYVPLREEFSAKHGDVLPVSGGKDSCHVLLASGGGDSYDALSGILMVFHDLYSDMVKENTIIFHVMVGSFNRNRQELKELAAKYPNVSLCFDVKNVAELMSRCDAAVSAAGTMLFELCAMQVPTVFFISADNQKYDSEFFAEEERMLLGGDMRMGREECLEKICGQLKRLLQDKPMRDRMKIKLHEVTDGRGAKRIAEEIASL